MLSAASSVSRRFGRQVLRSVLTFVRVVWTRHYSRSRQCPASLDLLEARLFLAGGSCGRCYTTGTSSAFGVPPQLFWQVLTACDSAVHVQATVTTGFPVFLVLERALLGGCSSLCESFLSWRRLGVLVHVARDSMFSGGSRWPPDSACAVNVRSACLVRMTATWKGLCTLDEWMVYVRFKQLVLPSTWERYSLVRTCDSGSLQQTPCRRNREGFIIIDGTF